MTLRARPPRPWLTPLVLGAALLVAVGAPSASAEEAPPVKIGLGYPETGPYAKQGVNQRRAAEMAADEINGAGGILGRKIQLVLRDTKSNPKVAKENAVELFDKEGVPMIFGGSSSAVAIATGKVALQKNKLFFGTLTYSTETTGEEGHRHLFRECYDSYAAAKVLSDYLNKNFSGKRYFYVTADYTWGWTTEEAFRRFTNTTDKNEHKGALTRLGNDDFATVLSVVKEVNPQVLVLVLFGRDMEIALRQAHEMGLKKSMQVLVPNLTLEMAEGAGPEAMEGVLGAMPWTWNAPGRFGHAEGAAFVKRFEERYDAYPSTAAASAYVILKEYKGAVERAGTFETKAVIKALEGHRYVGLKDEQVWRDWDHQSVQTVYAVKGKPADEVRKDKRQQDYFEIINVMKGEDATIGLQEWTANRAKVGMPATLEEFQEAAQ